jgi:hypothetical protein
MALPRPPFVVLCDGAPVGDVLDYGYETPWATGRFVARPGTIALAGRASCILRDADGVERAATLLELDGEWLTWRWSA